jgi:hypothetical protein
VGDDEVPGLSLSCHELAEGWRGIAHHDGGAEEETLIEVFEVGPVDVEFDVLFVYTAIMRVV